MEYPHLQKIFADRGGSDFVILSIDNQNKPEADAEFAKKVGVTFPMLLDDRQVAREIYKIRGTPTNLLIDREGRVVFTHLGFSPGQEKVLDAEVQALVQGSVVKS